MLLALKGWRVGMVPTPAVPRTPTPQVSCPPRTVVPRQALLWGVRRGCPRLAFCMLPSGGSTCVPCLAASRLAPAWPLPEPWMHTPSPVPHSP